MPGRSLGCKRDRVVVGQVLDDSSRLNSTTRLSNQLAAINSNSSWSRSSSPESRANALRDEKRTKNSEALCEKTKRRVERGRSVFCLNPSRRSGSSTDRIAWIRVEDTGRARCSVLAVFSSSGIRRRECTREITGTTVTLLQVRRVPADVGSPLNRVPVNEKRSLPWLAREGEHGCSRLMYTLASAADQRLKGHGAATPGTE